MERDLDPEFTSKGQDSMGDVPSKNFKNFNSSPHELHQAGIKRSCATFLEYSPALVYSDTFIESKQDYSLSTSSDNFCVVEEAVEALEYDEISKENETITYVKQSKDLLLPKGHDTRQPIFPGESALPKAIQQIDSEENEPTEAIQPPLSVESESTEEIQPALSEENKSTKETLLALSDKTESSEETQPTLSVESETVEETQPAFSVKTESNEVIQPILSKKKESTDDIHLDRSVENESTDDIQLALSVENESTEEAETFEGTESIRIQNPTLSGKALLTFLIQSSAFVENEVIQTPFEDMASATVIQSVICEKSESTESIQPAYSDTKLTKVKQPVLSKKLSEVIKFNSFPPALDSESFLSLLDTEEYKGGTYFVYVNEKACCGCQIIVAPSPPLPEPIFSDLEIFTLSPPTDNLQIKSNKKPNRSSESIQAVKLVETKLTKVRQPVLSQEITLNEIMELNSLESSLGIEKAISSSQSKRSKIPSNDLDSSAESDALSKGLSDSWNSEANSSSFPPAVDTERFYSLLNTDEFQNGSHSRVECQSHVNQSGGRGKVTPRFQLPESKFLNFARPPLSPATESRLKKIIENLNSFTPGNERNSKAALKFSEPEEQSNPSTPPLTAGKGRMTINTNHFEVLPSPTSPPKKSTGSLNSTKDVIVVADDPGTTCEPIHPNMETPLSPPNKDFSEKLIKILSSTRSGTVRKNLGKKRVLARLFSGLADWIYRGLDKSAPVSDKPIDDDFINLLKGELENGLDLLKQMAEFVDFLVTGAKSFPDPNAILPVESGSEKISIRDRLISAGLTVLRQLEKMEKEVISERSKFLDICSNEEKLGIDRFRSMELAAKVHDVIFGLYISISEHFLKLGMEIEKFRDHMRDFVFKIDKLRRL